MCVCGYNKFKVTPSFGNFLESKTSLSKRVEMKEETAILMQDSSYNSISSERELHF